MRMPHSLRLAVLGLAGLCVAGLALCADGKEDRDGSKEGRKELLEKLKDYKHKIVYETNRDGNWELYVVNADGTDPVNLTNTKDVDELYPKPSPDGTKICFVAGLTFWLGNATVLGLGILQAPQAARALDQLPLWTNRLVAVVILALLAAYVAWVWVKPRIIGREGWQVTLPGGPLTLLQIAIGIVDLACCAAAMYMLVPDEPNLGFVTVAVIFVAATLLGFASHAPGGLGVFDAAMLVALWQFDKEDLLAGLLLFRLLYYIVPFVLSLAVLGAREILLSRGMRRLSVAASPPLGDTDARIRRTSDLP